MFEPEERRIARRIKDFIKDEEPPEDYHTMLRNGRILHIRDYGYMVNSGKINPRDAYVYINVVWDLSRSDFYYPFLAWHEDLLDAYLSKQGFHFGYGIAPATGLKYVANVERYREYLSIEVTELDTAVNNTNLPKIMFEVLGDKLVGREKELTEKEYEKIYKMYKSQRLMAGYNFVEADTIFDEYYDKGNTSLAKEVARISIDYDRIFHLYRVCYDMHSWEEVDCWSIKLD